MLAGFCHTFHNYPTLAIIGIRVSEMSVRVLVELQIIIVIQSVQKDIVCTLGENYE